jgi:hypothetical protein
METTSKIDMLRKDWPIVFLIVLGVVIVFLFTDHHIDGDAFVRFAAIKLFMEDGKLSDTSYSMIGPLFSTPFWLIGKYIKTPEWWLARYNFFLFIAFLSGIWFRCKKNIDQKVLLYTLLVLISLSLFIPYQKNYMGEMFTAVLCGFGIILLSQNKQIGWLPLIIGTVNTPATLIGLGLITFYLILREKRLRYVIYPLLAFILIGIESYIRRGGFFITGYEGSHGFKTILPYSGQSDFSYPFVLGILSILFSFGKGIFFFVPGLWLLYDFKKLKENKSVFELIVLLLLFLGGEILIYSKWWAWYGGFYWGPRFFLISSIPSSLLIANFIRKAKFETFWKNALTFLIVLLSAWIVINGTIFEQRNLIICVNNNYQFELLCWYVPEFSVLIRPFIVWSPLTFNDVVFTSYIAIVSFCLIIPIVKLMLSKLFSEIKNYFSEIKNFRY